jgi:hypothetical protein
MSRTLKIYQKKVKFALRPGASSLFFAHRKIVLGGTTARRSHRLRRAVFFSEFEPFAEFLRLVANRQPLFAE